jgi:hypothetical protein
VGTYCPAKVLLRPAAGLLFNRSLLALFLLIVVGQSAIHADGDKLLAARPSSFPIITVGPSSFRHTKITFSYCLGKTTKELTSLDVPYLISDVPPCTVITLRSDPIPVKEQCEIDCAITIYDITQASRYKSILPQLAKLKTLLEQRPSNLPLEPADDATYLPDYPATDCSHFFQSKVHYIDNSQFDAVGYVTFFGNGITDVGSPFRYICQGISTDGKYFISGDFDVNAPVPPSRFNETHDAYNSRMALWLDKRADAYFNPSLKKLDNWIQTLMIN